MAPRLPLHQSQHGEREADDAILDAQHGLLHAGALPGAAAEGRAALGTHVAVGVGEGAVGEPGGELQRTVAGHVEDVGHLERVEVLMENQWRTMLNIILKNI